MEFYENFVILSLVLYWYINFHVFAVCYMYLLYVYNCIDFNQTYMYLLMFTIA